MSAKMGINMIEMYSKMVKEQFAPILQTLNVHNMQLRDMCEKEAKKELGIYSKMMRMAQLELELKELKLELDSYTTRSGHPYKTKIELLTDEKMKIIQNGFQTKVQKTMDDMVFKIKISGLDGDTKKVFEDLPDIITSLSKDVKKLPAPTKKLKLIKAAK